MGIFDNIFGKRKIEEESQLEKEQKEKIRLETANKRDEQVETSVEPFVFKSNCHQRYEDGAPKMGLQECLRTVSVVKNTNGCSGYRLAPGVGYIVKLFNDDLGKPNMSDKPMKVVRKTNDLLELRGFPIEAQSPFGWQEVDYSVYGLTVSYKNGEVDKCILHMYDRNIRIEYMKKGAPSKTSNNSGEVTFNNDISVCTVAQGGTFNLRLSNIRVVKEYYNRQTQNIEISPSAFANIVRKESNGMVSFDISNIEELRRKGVLKENPTFNPSFSYNFDGRGNEFASAEVENSSAAMTSGKEYVSLFQITRQNGKIVSFIINNLPNEDDFYYLIIFSE